ncbi:MAG TPA: PKD domain-containing protein, partial [Holophaga sp.]|nr:PKD domain-containing protein [Holophaga sp.]
MMRCSALTPFAQLLIVAAVPPIQHVSIRPATTTGAPSISLDTLRARVDAPTSFHISGKRDKSITWDFGDGTPAVIGGSSIAHVYRSAGSFTVKAVGGGSADQVVTIAEPRRIVTPSASELSIAPVVKPGSPVTLRLEAALGKTITWDFGDGSAPMSATNSASSAGDIKATRPARNLAVSTVTTPGKEQGVSHTYTQPGTYTVTARDLADTPREFKLTLNVGGSITTTATTTNRVPTPSRRDGLLALSLVSPRWEDGHTERAVTKADKLSAFVDLKFDGSGELQAQWVLDGQAQPAFKLKLGGSITSRMANASPRLADASLRKDAPGSLTIASQDAGDAHLDLPTSALGDHTLTLKVLQPKLAFQVPALRYSVKAGGELGPIVKSVSPASAKPGDEVELILSGANFTPDMKLDLGKDVAMLGAPRIIAPDKAVVKVFIAPTAQAGNRTFQTRRKMGGGPLIGNPPGGVHLEILAPGNASTKVGSEGIALRGKASPAKSLLDKVSPDKSVPNQKAVLIKDAVTGRGSRQDTKPDEKRSPIKIVGAIGPLAKSIALAEIPRFNPGAARVAVAADGIGRAIVVHDRKKGKDGTPDCKDMKTPSVQHISHHYGNILPKYTLKGDGPAEFKEKADIIPYLQDTTQFAWKEDSPSGADYFELKFYAGNTGKFLKTVRVPGKQHFYDVPPQFEQDLGRNADSTTSPSKTGNNSAGGSSTSTSRRGGKWKRPDAPTSQPPQTVANGPSETVSSPEKSQAALEPDIAIPPELQGKAAIIWQVSGYRNMPCVTWETDAPTKASQASDTPTAQTVTTKSAPTRVSGIKRGLPQTDAGGTSRTSDRLITQLGDRTASRVPPPTQKIGARSSTGLTPAALQTAPSSTAPESIQSTRGSITLPSNGIKTPVQTAVYHNVPVMVMQADPMPINRPDTATGINNDTGCASTSKLNNKNVVITLDKTSSTAQGQPAIQEIVHPGDQVMLSGDFDLTTRMPYSLIPIRGWQKDGQKVGEVFFSNVFVDWGDGTVVPFYGRPSSPKVINPNTVYNGIYTSKLTHTYTHVHQGGYNVHVFAISGDDMQDPNITKYLHTSLAPSSSDSSAFSMLHRRGSTITDRKHTVSDAISPTLSKTVVPSRISTSGKTSPIAALAKGPGDQVLSRAFMIWCGNRDVVDRADPCVSAPLQLVSVSVNLPDDLKTGPSNPANAGSKQPQPTSKSGPQPAPGKEMGDLRREPKAAAISKTRTTAADRSKAIDHAKGMATPPPVLQTDQSHLPSASSCNLFYSATATVTYKGSGNVNLIWKVDGRQIGSADKQTIEQPPARTDLTEKEIGINCYDLPARTKTFTSPALTVDMGGKNRHKVTVEVYVAPSKSADLTQGELASLVQHGTNVGASNRELHLSPRLTQTVANMLESNQPGPSRMQPERALTSRPTTGAKLDRQVAETKPFRMGLLNPNQTHGEPAFLSLADVAKAAVSPNLRRSHSGRLIGERHDAPPYTVVGYGEYQVVAAQPDQVCSLYFPTKGGDFLITNLGSSFKQNANGKASGSGIMPIPLHSGTAPDTATMAKLNVTFSDWQLSGAKVTSGHLEVTPTDLTFAGHGLTGTVTSVKCDVGQGQASSPSALQDLMVQMKLQPIDSNIVVVAKGDPPPTWTAESPLDLDGNWYAAEGLDHHPFTMPVTRLGTSPWTFSSTGIVLDLSTKTGSDPKGGGSPAWMGAALGTVSVKPEPFSISEGTWSNLPHPTNWTLENNDGVLGTLDTGPWKVGYMKGSVAIGNIHFEHKSGSSDYQATYQNVEIRAPWLKNPLKGDASWIRQYVNGNKGDMMLSLKNLNVASVPVVGGGSFTLAPSDLQLLQYEGVGLVLKGKGQITLKAENKDFTSFPVEGLALGIDGQAYFCDASTNKLSPTKSIALNRSTHLGPTPADLQTALLSSSQTDVPL